MPRRHVAICQGIGKMLGAVQVLVDPPIAVVRITGSSRARMTTPAAVSG